MKKSSFYLMGLILLTTFIITGCVQKSGSTELSTLTKTNLDESIQDGITTKQDILFRFGMAHKLEKNKEGSDIWTYTFTKKSAKPINFIPFINLLYHGTNNSTKELTIVFDKQDTAIQHHLILHQDDTKAGALPTLF